MDKLAAFVLFRQSRYQDQEETMTIFAMKGFKGKTIHGARSTGKLEIRGCFFFQGPQPVDDDGGAPVWVADLMDNNPELNQVALSYKDRGVVYSRIPDNQPLEPTCEGR